MRAGGSEIPARGALLATLVLAGCPGVPPPENPITSGREMVRLLGALRGQARSLRAKGRADHLGPEGRVRGTVMFFAEREAHLRFDALTPAQTTAQTLTSDGERFALLDAGERRFYTGPAEPCNIARLLRIPLAARDIVEILLGGTPLVGRAENATVTWDDDGYYVLRLESEDGTLDQRVHVSGERDRLDVFHSVVRDRRGVYFEITYDDHARIDGVRLARKIHFEMPGEDADVLVRYDDVEVNVSFPADAFRQEVPAGLRAEEVTCR